MQDHACFIMSFGGGFHPQQRVASVFFPLFAANPLQRLAARHQEYNPRPQINS